MSTIKYKSTIDDESIVDKIVQSLSFEVEAIPQGNVTKVSNTDNTTPFNVKIRVRKKNGFEFLHRGVISVPKFSEVNNTSKERIRLVSSDQTIMSFSLLMEADLETKRSKKPRKHFFNMFKTGGCLGTGYDDDEEFPYMSSSSDKKHDIQKLGLKQNINSNEANQNQTMKNVNTKNQNYFFGKCKPGGCLDPPFGEDKYPYKPVLEEPATAIRKKGKLSLTHESIKERNNLASNSSQITKKKWLNVKEQESKTTLSLFESESMKKSLQSTYSNSIITYPLAVSSRDLLGFTDNNGKHVRQRSSGESKPKMPSRELTETYYIPLKSMNSQKQGRDNSDEDQYKNIKKGNNNLGIPIDLNVNKTQEDWQSVNTSKIVPNENQYVTKISNECLIDDNKVENLKFIQKKVDDESFSNVTGKKSKDNISTQSYDQDFQRKVNSEINITVDKNYIYADNEHESRVLNQDENLTEQKTLEEDSEPQQKKIDTQETDLITTEKPYTDKDLISLSPNNILRTIRNTQISDDIQSKIKSPSHISGVSNTNQESVPKYLNDRLLTTIQPNNKVMTKINDMETKSGDVTSLISVSATIPGGKSRASLPENQSDVTSRNNRKSLISCKTSIPVFTKPQTVLNQLEARDETTRPLSNIIKGKDLVLLETQSDKQSNLNFELSHPEESQSDVEEVKISIESPLNNLHSETSAEEYKLIENVTPITIRRSSELTSSENDNRNMLEPYVEENIHETDFTNQSPDNQKQKTIQPKQSIESHIDATDASDNQELFISKNQDRSFSIDANLNVEYDFSNERQTSLNNISQVRSENRKILPIPNDKALSHNKSALSINIDIPSFENNDNKEIYSYIESNSKSNTLPISLEHNEDNSLSKVESYKEPKQNSEENTFIKTQTGDSTSIIFSTLETLLVGIEKSSLNTNEKDAYFENDSKFENYHISSEMISPNFPSKILDSSQKEIKSSSITSEDIATNVFHKNNSSIAQTQKGDSSTVISSTLETLLDGIEKSSLNTNEKDSYFKNDSKFENYHIFSEMISPNFPSKILDSSQKEMKSSSITSEDIATNVFHKNNSSVAQTQKGDSSTIISSTLETLLDGIEKSSLNTNEKDSYFKNDSKFENYHIFSEMISPNFPSKILDSSQKEMKSSSITSDDIATNVFHKKNSSIALSTNIISAISDFPKDGQSLVEVNNVQSDFSDKNKDSPSLVAAQKEFNEQDYPSDDPEQTKYEGHQKLQSDIKKHVSSVIVLDLAFQSYLSNTKKANVLKAIDPSQKVHRYPNDTITIIQSTIKDKTEEMTFPVDNKKDMTIYFVVKDKKRKTAENKNTFRLKAGKASSIHPLQAKYANETIIAQALTSIYEKQLVPLQEVIKNLKDEIDDLAQQQERFRDNLLGIRKSKSMRLLPTNESCGCIMK